MIPLIETLEINLWLQFLIDATMKSVVILTVAGFGFGSRGMLGCTVLLRHPSAVGSGRSTGNPRAISGRPADR